MKAHELSWNSKSNKFLAMNHFLFFFLFVFFFNTIGISQNICTNGDFEDYTALPSTFAEICKASGWENPAGYCFLVIGSGSPDYYHTSGSGGANPPSTFWADVMPNSGDAMMGFVTWYDGNFREYLGRQLSEPMVVGTEYEISFWLTNGESWLHQTGANNLGIYFSSSLPSQDGGDPILVDPQIEMADIFYSEEWVQFTFYYTATFCI